MRYYLKLARRGYTEFSTEDKCAGLSALISEFGGFLSTPPMETEEKLSVSFFNHSDHDEIIIGQFEAGLRELDYVQIQ